MPDTKMHEGWIQSMGLREMGEEPATHMDGPTDKEIAMAKLEAERKKAQSQRETQRGRVITEEALRTINGERQDAYGAPEDTFKKIADLWTAYLFSNDPIDMRITPPMVADMMCLLKIAREKGGKGKRDNMVDLIGYAALGAEMRGYK